MKWLEALVGSMFVLKLSEQISERPTQRTRHSRHAAQAATTSFSFFCYVRAPTNADLSPSFSPGATISSFPVAETWTKKLDHFETMLYTCVNVRRSRFLVQFFLPDDSFATLELSCRIFVHGIKWKRNWVGLSVTQSFQNRLSLSFPSFFGSPNFCNRCQWFSTFSLLSLFYTKLICLPLVQCCT